MTAASTLRRFGSIHPTGNGVTISALHPAHRSGRSIFPSRVFDPDERALNAFPALHVFGFTARDPESEIGRAVHALASGAWERFAVRFSGAEGPVMASRIVDGFDAEAIICPAQEAKTDCCATCALCWSSDRSIGFRRH